MCTLFNRLYAYSKANDLPMPSHEWRTDLGIKAAKLFKESGIQKPYTRIKAKPYDCIGYVANYPIEFKKTLDNLVKDYYDNPPTEPPIPYVQRITSPKQFPPETSQKIKPKLKPSPQPSIPKLKLRKRLPPKGEPVFSSKLLKEKQ